MFTHPETTLILGGNGKTGRRVAERLIARNLPVRIASRNGTPAFDWDKPDTWRANVVGARSVYLSYYPDLALPGAAEQIREFAKVAVANGVRRIVLLSDVASHKRTQASARFANVARLSRSFGAAWFAQNFSEGHLAPAVLRGEIALPSEDVPEPFIDVEDIADVAVLALTDDAHDGKTYDLTGPRLVTFNEAATEIGKASQREVRYRAMPPADFTSMLGEHMQMPAEVAAFLTDLFAGLMDGHNSHVSPDVERLLGKKGRDFSAYVENAAKSGAWSAATAS